MARSVNCVHLIGNLTRDPELRSTASGRPVCDLGLATNRQWKSETGEQKEETEFHRIVAWGKLAEIASQYLQKGMRVYFQGRIATRTYTGQDGTHKFITEIIAEDMMMLSGEPSSSRKPKDAPPPPSAQLKHEPAAAHDHLAREPIGTPSEPEIDPDEIPF
jgi:single-strand DNA-binding protein